MNRILKKFLQRGVDLSPVGVELREDNTNYFCTPKGASVFGWAGIDGIHFCFIRGFGEMVFSVSPMNTSPDYVHPVAENFTDFLRLILACGDVAAVEQKRGCGTKHSLKPFSMKTLQPRNNSKLYRKFQRR